METFSMNIIAQTLSSHSEMIAPGVMGINFMKPEKPINTMSEVYKLVQEEEQNKVKSPTPGSGPTLPLFRPSKIPPTAPPKPKVETIPTPAPIQTPAPSVPLKPSAPLQPQGPSQGPCSDCGRIIYGQFVSLSDRILHEECFNCSTCGASLKQTGFHNINNKLYCDVHAKLAARVIATASATPPPGFAPTPVQPAAPRPSPVPPQKTVAPPTVKPLPTTPTATPAYIPSAISQTVPTPFGMSNLPHTPSSSGGLAFRSISPQPFKRISGEYHRVNAPSSPTPGSTPSSFAYSSGPLPFEMKPYMPPDQPSSILFSNLNDSSQSSFSEISQSSQVTQIIQKTTQVTQQSSQTSQSLDYKQVIGGQQTKKFVWPPQKSPFEMEPSNTAPSSNYSPLATQSIPAAPSPQPPEPALVQHPEFKPEAQQPTESAAVPPMKEFVVPPLPTTFSAQPAIVNEAPEPAATVMEVQQAPPPPKVAPAPLISQGPQASNFSPVLPPVIDLKPTTAPLQPGVPTGAGSKPAPKKGRGQLMQEHTPGRIPICGDCGDPIRGPFIIALNRTWCPDHFHCNNLHCKTPLIDIGFVEEQGQLYCENCYEAFLAPICNKCNVRIKGDCLNALDKQFHPECFICGYCNKPFGNNSFYLEDGVPYCEKDWNELFTTKCVGCGFPIEAGDRWVEAMNNNYHSQCFKCSKCQKNLEGQSFYAKGGKPYCKQHAR